MGCFDSVRLAPHFAQHDRAQHDRVGNLARPMLLHFRSCSELLSGHDRQHEMRRHRTGAIDALGCGDEVGGCGPVDTGNKFLRIAVDHREPGGLNLHHDAMTLQKDMVVIA